MNAFSNESIVIEELPKYEAVDTTPVQASYWKVMLINFFIILLFIGAALTTAIILVEAMKPYAWYIIAAFIFIMGIVFFLLKTAFHKRRFALRERDIIYKSGLISNHTIIIPFNRIQHVGLNEGFISRFYGLAQLQIFTAGGSSSDLKISGLLKQEAESIREVIMQKIVSKSSQEVNNEIEGEIL